MFDEILGDFYISVDRRVIEKQDRQANHNAELLEMMGKRLGMYSETAEAMALNDATLKKISGGGADQLSARAPYGKEIVKFIPLITLFILTNHKPFFDVFDAAMVERIRLLPWFAVFQKGEDFQSGIPNHFLATPDFARQFLANHKDELFTWLVQGSIDFYERGCQFPPMPDLVRQETELYLGELNWFQQFLDDHFHYVPQHQRPTFDKTQLAQLPENLKTTDSEPFVSTEEMLLLLDRWAEASSNDVSKRKFMQLMKKHYSRDTGRIRWMGKYSRGYKWFMLKDNNSDDQDNGIM